MALELEFAVFHCALFLARWSPPHPLAVVLPLPWPRGPSSQPSLILVFLGSLWGWLWWGAGIAQVLVTWPGCLPPPPLDRSFREATPHTVVLLPFSLLPQVWGPSLVTHREPGLVPTWCRVLLLPTLSKGAGMASFLLLLPAPELRAPAHSPRLADLCPGLFFSYWNIVDLQCWVGFKCTEKWFSYI